MVRSTFEKHSMLCVKIGLGTRTLEDDFFTQHVTGILPALAPFICCSHSSSRSCSPPYFHPESTSMQETQKFDVTILAPLQAQKSLEQNLYLAQSHWEMNPGLGLFYSKLKRLFKVFSYLLQPAFPNITLLSQLRGIQEVQPTKMQP